ncbi:MAG: sulfotransferase [Pleurocapsa sp.]
MVCAPRSGSTLLFETLSLSPSVWTIGGESHGIFESIKALQPAQKKYHSNVLTAADVTSEIAAKIKNNFIGRLRDRDGNQLNSNLFQVTLLEKTPKNALRISFLNAIFPDALFIYLHREPKANISSIIEAWKSKHFVTYPKLPGWNGEPWSLLLTPQWQDLNGQSLAQIAKTQWKTTHEAIMNSLQCIDAKRWQTVSYEDLIQNPQAEMKRLCQFADIEWDRNLSPGSLALSKFTLTPPQPDKWKQNESVIMPLLEEIQPTCDRLNEMCRNKYIKL